MIGRCFVSLLLYVTAHFQSGKLGPTREARSFTVFSPPSGARALSIRMLGGRRRNRLGLTITIQFASG